MMVVSTRDRWKTRRWMAKMAFWVLILSLPASVYFYYLGWIDAKYIIAISGIAISVMSAIAAIITMYIGASAYDDVNNK